MWFCAVSLLERRDVCMHSCTYRYLPTLLYISSQEKECCVYRLVIWVTHRQTGYHLSEPLRDKLQSLRKNTTPVYPLPLHLLAGHAACPPTAGLTSYLINIDRPLVPTHTHTNCMFTDSHAQGHAQR